MQKSDDAKLIQASQRTAGDLLLETRVVELDNRHHHHHHRLLRKKQHRTNTKKCKHIKTHIKTIKQW